MPLEKLDHFLEFITSSRVVQDLPFGEKTLKLSNNTEIRVPNVLRISTPEQIVKQYVSYCGETDFLPLSRRTLCRILSVCAVSTRTSLQGLDYFSADVSSSSRVPDHCRPYSLSVSSDTDYASLCKHQHDLTCDSCNLFPATIKK